MSQEASSARKQVAKPKPEAWVSRKHLENLVSAFDALSDDLRLALSSQFRVVMLCAFALGLVAGGAVFAAITFDLWFLLVITAVCVFGVFALYKEA